MMSSSNGLFVSIDGPSGVGKTTTVHALAQLLRNDGRAVHVTAEPSGGPIGKLARELTEKIQGASLACLYAADRYHHLTSEVLPHVGMGEIVITDRYIPSALVMQQGLRTGSVIGTGFWPWVGATGIEPVTSAL